MAMRDLFRRRRADDARRRLVESIGADRSGGFGLWSTRPLDDRVLEAIARVPREEFVPALEKPFAYDDRALPIGGGQTISQPTVVAYMTNLLAVRPDHVVLEIGTGSGYQAAVLAELAGAVHSVEIIASLAAAARRRLRALGYDNVEVHVGNGRAGWPEAAPYDAVLVTAASPEIPDDLVAQLREGGRLVAPLGEPGAIQRVTLLEKGEDGRVRHQTLMPVRFVPLTGGAPQAP